MRCFFDVALMCSTIAARVVDLPHPVDPDSNTMPRGDSAIDLRIGNSPSSSKLGTLILT